MAALSRVGEIVRRHDPDRFFTALFAPAAKREALFTLYAFNHELARAREVTSQPIAVLIRLQWWREVVEGARRRHEVAGPLGEALDAGALHGPDLEAMIEGREADRPDTIEAWREVIRGTAGALAVAAGRALGAGEVEALRDLGSAYGAAGVLRNVALTGNANLGALAPDLAAAGLTWLAAGTRQGIPRPALPAALPAVYARRDLRRSQPVHQRRIGDKLAIVLAALSGRI